MDMCPSLIRKALDGGIMAHESGREEAQHELTQTLTRMQWSMAKTKERMVLFLGAAISTFKPAQLPMWNEFVKLLWTSCMEVAFPSGEIESYEAVLSLSAFFEELKGSVPNYLVTEVISRRLGMQYLDVLEAFRAQRGADGQWAVNTIHRWAASCLSTGEVAAIMTTNFDNYIEKALELEGANFYQVVGEHEVDDQEIQARLSQSGIHRRLVLIVNGARSFAFVRSLMPQLGGGKITFLFKLHGSCYDPPSCIDTRLQRAQGLPSFCTDILDILLKRTVWLVAGFSGSDMNDNLDYLRFLSNRNHARIFWLSFPGSEQESAIRRLSSELPYSSESTLGLSHLHLWFIGQRISGQEKFDSFDQKILEWAGSLGKGWCKLILLDLIALFAAKSSISPAPELLQNLVNGPELRQDWNPILQGMDLHDHDHQSITAQHCARTWSMLSSILSDAGPVGSEKADEICHELNEELSNLKSLHDDMKSRAMVQNSSPLHAQAWVLSALSGLAQLCGGDFMAAIRSLEVSSTMARIVGDDETNRLVVSIIAQIHHQGIIEHPPIPADPLDTFRPSRQDASFFAFSPAMDNVNSKMNIAGVPPQVYLRALLHRSILFTDAMAVLPATITNSTVFVDEVLFQGEIDELNQVYAQHILLVLPDKFRNQPKKLQSYRDSRAKGFIFEPVNQSHVRILDEYFDAPEHQHQIMYYNEDGLMADYGSHLRNQVEDTHRRNTVDHLVRHWVNRGKVRHQSLPAKIGASQSMHGVHSAVDDLVKSFAHVTRLLPRKLTRSSLYKYADLFDEASEADAFVQDFMPDIPDDQKTELIAARNRMLNRPWLYGPLCHELFDIPYRANLIFAHAASSRRQTFIFLEESDVHSWEHTSKVRKSADSSAIGMKSSTPGISHNCSSLLLSQLPTETLLRVRHNLAPMRAKIFSGKALSEADRAVIEAELMACGSGPAALPESNIKHFVDLDEKTRQAAQQLLNHCIFIVRRGAPLDPMYEEAHLAIPGLYELQALK